MSISELRKQVHLYIENADERFLRMVNSLAKEYKSKQSDPVAYRAGDSLTSDELHNELKEAEEEIKRGDFDPIDDFDKDSSQWD